MGIKIGIFDSGIGGLSIATAIRETYSNVAIHYIADTQFMPYGDRSKEQIRSRASWCANELVKLNTDMIVIACNTATAASVDMLRRMHDIPIVGVEPDIHFHQRDPVKINLDSTCVLCTMHTLQSEKFTHLKQQRDPENLMHYKGMKNLATLVEAYFQTGRSRFSLKNIVTELKRELGENQFQHIVLGCTHYELIAHLIEAVTGAKTVSIAKAVARRCQHLLPTLELKLDCGIEHESHIRFMDTRILKWSLVDLNYFKTSALI